MLLLTNILRSRYRGVIHFHPAEADRPPAVEFSHGEGPEQVMNQIQDFALPEIRKNVEPLGPYLRWEELDLEARVVRRHRSRFDDRLEFALSADELGIELVLPAAADGPNVRPSARPWVPLRPLAEPGEGQRGLIGWSVERPALRWRYLQTRYAPPAIEMTWSCASLPAHWAARVLDRTRRLDCYIGNDQPCPLNATRDGLLVYRGFHPLADGSTMPASLPVLLERPLAVVAGTGEAEHALDEEVPATVDALDFRALIDGRSTRLVADSDLDRRFEAEVWTTEDSLLPEMIPAGQVPGLPWDVQVSARGETHDGVDRKTPEAENRRRWLLAPCSRNGSWRDVRWEQKLSRRRRANGTVVRRRRANGTVVRRRRADGTPSLGFGLGAFDPCRAPRITHIANRRASVAWRVEASDRGDTLCLCVPHFVPIGCPGRVALPVEESSGFDYAAEVRASLDGLEERFVIDQRSEVPANRLFLDPRRWRFHDQHRGAIAGGEALGEGAGCVRWRRSTGDGEDHQPELKPTDWAGGSAPVLLLDQGTRDAHTWGGLYAPGTVPWAALEAVPAEPTPDPERVLFVPRAAAPDRSAPIWIDLWGFICRYQVHRLAFSRSHGQISQPTAWIMDPGLELFPRRGRHLLRSFSPIYAVRDPAPRRFSLRPTSPRPTLHVGRDTDGGPGPLVLDVGPETYVRCQLAAPGQVPDTFEPGRVPGTRLRLDRIGRGVVWIAIEQRPGGEARRAGYLLSCDATRGWRFRGFFAHQGAAVELGVVRRGDRRRRVFLGAEGASRIPAFRLTIDRRGDHWSDNTPAAARETSPESIRAWEVDHFALERRPAPLQGYAMRIRQQSTGDQPWIFELFDGESRIEDELPAGIRVWRLHGDADEELAGSARELGEDPVEPAEPPPAEPEKRILRADDDDDDYF